MREIGVLVQGDGRYKEAVLSAKNGPRSKLSNGFEKNGAATFYGHLLAS